MKVALLTPTFSSFSGIDKIVLQKAQEYGKKGDKVTIFALEADMATKEEVIVMGMPKNQLMQRIYRLFFFLDPGKVNKYSKMLKDYDLAISFFYPMNLIASAARKKYKIKYVYWNAGVAYPSLFTFPERIYLNIFNFLTNRTIRNADEVYSISEFLRKELHKETGIDSKVEHVKVDSSRFNAKISKKLAEEVKKRHSIKGKMVLFIGRVSPHKGIHLLIRAFELVRQKMPDACLVIVGKHTFLGYSKELNKLSGKGIIFAGYVKDEDLPAYYAASDVYATASLWEGFDIPCVEAQYCGKKVVAFDVGSHKEVVKKGELVPLGDVKKFGEALLRQLK